MTTMAVDPMSPRMRKPPRKSEPSSTILLARSSVGSRSVNIDDILPDALAELIGEIVAEARHEFRKEIERAAAEWRATVAELRAQNVELRSENVELRRSLKDDVAGEIALMHEAASRLRNGSDGQPGERGEQGPPGPSPDYGIVLENSEPLLRSLIEARWDDWTKTLPLPERGEPGPAGEKGERGADPDPKLIAQMVADEVAKIPPVEPGAKGDPGDPGRDGRDIDPAVVEATIVAHVTKAIAEMPRPRDGIDGKDGAPGEKGDPGIGEQGERGEQGPAGAAGRDGRDADQEVIEALVSEKVAAAIAALPLPEKGERGEKGEPGMDGLPGDRGEKGEKGDPGISGRDGKDGIGLAGGFIDRAGILVLTATDGTVREVGMIVGKDGEPGARGADGRDGVDGKDGLSFADFELDPEFDGERTIRLRWTNGEKEHIREWRLPVVLDRGVYQSGRSYAKADGVSFGGSWWIAQADTTDKPGNGSTAWRLAVKRGADGRDGKEGPKGEKGDPGRPGVDLVHRP
jgi:collagen type III alpha